MRKKIIWIVGYGAMMTFLSHCANMVPQTSASGTLPAASPAVAPTASGVWSGVVNYTVINGSAFQTSMQFSISPSLDRVTTVAEDSGADTVAARRSGDTVSWTILGSEMVTDVTLQPVSGGTARVTSRVTKDGKVMATGGGMFVRRG